MSLFLGTSGWAYREWKPGFYPHDLPRARWLEFYTHALTACEINSSFYRVDEGHNLARWAAIAPPAFRFAAKAHRSLTNVKDIAPDPRRLGLLHDFLRSMESLGSKLGALLFQFPGFRARDDEVFDAFLSALPSGGRYAFEFVNDTWLNEHTSARAAEAGATICLSETSGAVPSELPPGPFAYVRLRAGHYDEPSRRGWLDLLQREAARRDVYAFTKHKSLDADDEFSGVGLARWLVANHRR